MAMQRYVALLRGINVGGRNAVAMADLRAAFADAGHGEVRTYIQSGNVLFSSEQTGRALEPSLERLLADRFDLPIAVVVRSRRQLRRVVDEAPEGFGADPDTFLCDVVFLKAPLTTRRAMEVVTLRDGVDQAWPGTGVVYFSRVAERRTQSRLSRLVSSPEYQRMTIRNWATTTRLRSMLDE